jgi:VIT1/CCC1 family predicted Fe2+/Mn2+ transporter
MPVLPAELVKRILVFQKSEITEYRIYAKLAAAVKDPDNSRVLKRIAADELRHHDFWREQTGREVRPCFWKIFLFFWMARILGITFAIKLMERGEEQAELNYTEISQAVPGARQIAADEDQHEKELIGLIEEERLNYMGSVVLGLNDALVELTGALAGLTFALQNTRLIALAGLITGIAASFSMAASEYLSTKSEGKAERALTSAVYTGIAYILTVFLLILPYLLVQNHFLCLGVTLLIALTIIFLFNFYISVARDYSFGKRFLEMAGLSLGVALLSFAIGFVIRHFLGIEV